MWTVLDFSICSCEILSYDSEAKELDTTNQQQSANNRCPSGNRIAKTKLSDD